MLSFYRSISKHEGKLTLSYVGLYLASLVFIIGLNHDFWTDEGHFYRTILLFISKPSLHTLAHYEEMSTPLPFILYALWGKLVGIEISSLRLFSLILSAATFFCLHYLISFSFPGMKIRALVAVISFSLIPYVPGLSFFVYTDMPAILFMLLAWICLIKNLPIPLFFFASASVWSRQYLVFFIAAGLVYSFLMAFNEAEREKSISLGFSLLLAMASLLPLAIIWGGLSPDNEVKNQYLVNTTRYNFHALQAYLYSISLFSLPVLLPIIPFLIRNKGIVISSLAASFTYWLFPVQTSEASMQLGYFHVGFFHKFLSKIFLSPWQMGVVFQGLIFLSLLFIFSAINNMISNLRKHNSLETLSICLFLVVMPFSYLTWEKYAIPVIPFVYVHVFGSKEFSLFLEAFKRRWVHENPEL